MTPPQSEVERLATLEVEAIEAARQREEIRARLRNQDGDLRAIRNDVHEIKTNISGHLGFLKGVVFVFTALGAAIGAGLAALWDKITGG